MNAKTQPHDLPEGACVTAKVPERNQALLGDVVVNPYRLAPLTAIIRDGGRTLSAAHVRVLGRGERGVAIATTCPSARCGPTAASRCSACTPTTSTRWK
jgi:arylsulfate sulfotransferase